MHEMGIASSVLKVVREEAVKRAPNRVLRVGLRVGEWSGVDSESLRFAFEAMVKGSDLDPLGLDLEFRTRQNYCPHCDHGFPLEMFEVRCPLCGAIDTEPSEGAELEFAYLEMEN